MPYEIEFYTIDEARTLGIEFDKAIALKTFALGESGPPICPPERVAFWLRTHINAGEKEPAIYTQSCDVVSENEQVGKVWKPTNIVFIAKSF